MQIENDYDKEVYNGDIGYIDDVELSASGSLCASTTGQSPTDLANLTSWYRPMRRPFIKAKGQSIPP